MARINHELLPIEEETKRNRKSETVSITILETAIEQTMETHKIGVEILEKVSISR